MTTEPTNHLEPYEPPRLVELSADRADAKSNPSPYEEGTFTGPS